MKKIRHYSINSDLRLRRGNFMVSATFKKIPIGYNENIFKNIIIDQDNYNEITFYIR